MEANLLEHNTSSNCEVKMFYIFWAILLWSPLTAADHSVDELKAKINEETSAKSIFYKFLPMSKKGFSDKGFNDWDFYGRWRFFPWDEYRHYPGQTYSYKVPPPLPNTVKGETYTIPPDTKTPDFRMPEPPYRALNTWYRYFEEDRYYRTSPAFLQLHLRWGGKNYRDTPWLLSCYCVTVFKRLTPLGMCAILTLRHVLTTASSTDLIVRKYRATKWTLVDILGFWYETDTDGEPWNNASYYGTPARIHYHPKFIKPEYANRSHPFPNSYDLAVWGTTYQLINPGQFGGKIATAIKYGRHAFNWFYGIGMLVPKWFYKQTTTQVCSRCSGWTNYWFDSPTLGKDNMAILVGAQMVKDIGREPFPWFKYAIRTTSGKRNPCPKVEWGWFHCIEMAGQVGKLGHDSGGILHIAYRSYIWNHRYSGLAGINSFSMRLRSKYFVNYYTVLERHIVLDFLYAAYMGVVPYEWKDYRFQNTKWRGKVLPAWWYWAVGIRDKKYRQPYPENINYDTTWWSPKSWIYTIQKYLPLVTLEARYEPIWW